jgi:hypothetical protein
MGYSDAQEETTWLAAPVLQCQPRYHD